MSSGGTPYIGSKISLISKAEIRYEGILYDVNTKDSTVTLSKVRSHGTEGRPAPKVIQPRQEVYEYIIFRGSDIKDLSVNEISKPHPPPQEEEPEDPAILSATSVAPPTSRPNTTAPPGIGVAQTNPPGLPHPPPPTHSVPPTHSIPPPPMYNPFPMGPTGGGTSGGYNPFGLPYFNRPPVMINPQAPGHNKPSTQQQQPQQSQSLPPPPAPQRISSSPAATTTTSSQLVPPSQQPDPVNARSSPLVKAEPSLETSPPAVSTVGGIETSTPNTSISPKDQDKTPSWNLGSSDSQKPKEVESRHKSHTPKEESQGQRRDDTSRDGHYRNNRRGGGGGGGNYQNNRGNRGSYRQYRDHTYSTPRPSSGNERRLPNSSSSSTAPPTKQPLRYDVDFDFDSANALFSKESLEKEIKRELRISEDSIPSTDDVPRPQLEGEESVEPSEDGEEEPLEAYNKMVSFFDNISCEANSSNKRHSRNEERSLNTETFGVTSRGYRGNNRQRGRGRGYYGGGDRRYHDNYYRHDNYQSGEGDRYRGNRSRGGVYRGRGRGDYHGNSRRGDYARTRDY